MEPQVFFNIVKLLDRMICHAVDGVVEKLDGERDLSA
jgi:hypothetical protein